MPTLTYALEKDGPQRLEIAWRGMYRNVTVALDGNELGTIPDQRALAAGESFSLPDGSRLSVQLVRKLSGAELQVLRNGQPLPGSASDPESRLKGAYGIIFFVAVLNLVLGLITVLGDVEFLQSIGIGPYSIAFGVLFAVLGYFTMRRSVAALVLAIVLFALDAILGVALAAGAGATPNVAGIVFRVLLIWPMAQGVGAIRTLKERDTL